MRGWPSLNFNKSVCWLTEVISTSPRNRAMSYDLARAGLVSGLLRLAEHATVLDVGCIGGDYRQENPPLSPLHLYVMKCCSECVGLDMNISGLKRMRGTKSHLVLATAHSMPFKSGSFDYVVACDVLEHLDLPGAFFDECGRILKTGGALIGTVPNAWSIALWSIYVSFLLGRQPPATRHSTHVTVYDEYCLKFLALTHGFKARCYCVACGTRIERIFLRFVPKASQILGFLAWKVSDEIASRLCREAITYAEAGLSHPVLWSKSSVLGR